MSWHSRTIEGIKSRLNFLRNRLTINTNHGAQAGPDIEIILTIAGAQRRINIEIQQFDSGAPWTRTTIPSWQNRHDLATLVVFPEPTLERVLNERNNNRMDCNFFRNLDVFLFHDKQLEDVISLIIRLSI
jgi:hypothetical protein